MNPNTWLAILTAALVLITAYYAWTTNKMLGTIQDMVAATKDLVGTTWKTYALTVVPRVECHTVDYDNGQDPSAEAPVREPFSETRITNVGSHRVRLSRVRLEGDSDGEHVRRFVDRWLVTNESETVRLPLGKSGHNRVFVHLEDMAGESHVVLSEHVRGN